MQVRFDLEVHAWEQSGEMGLYWVYKRDLFDGWRMEQMARHYARVLEMLVQDPDRPVDQVELVSGEERRRILEEWNHTQLHHPQSWCLHRLFEEQTEKTPDAIAAVYEGACLSYVELNRKANCLAHRLRRYGAGPGKLVGICLERSLDMVISILAVLKAGSAYVPLDPGYPRERLEYMAQDGGLCVLVTQEKFKHAISCSGEILVLEREWSRIARESGKNPDNRVDLSAGAPTRAVL